MSKEYDLVFVNGVSSCGCTMNFSDGHGEYSDVHRINFCPRHSASEIARSIVATGELTRPEHESLEAEVCELARHPASADQGYLSNFEEIIMLISRGLADVERGIHGYHDPQIQAFWENYKYSKGIRAGEPS